MHSLRNGNSGNFWTNTGNGNLKIQVNTANLPASKLPQSTLVKHYKKIADQANL